MKATTAPIATKTLAGGKKYFDSMGYEVMADWTANSAVLPAESVDWKAVKSGQVPPPRIRQKPGKENFMGLLKFTFPNSQDIYLHDTPSRELFSRNQRTYSSGCIRISNPVELAEYLLKHDPKWNKDTIKTASTSGKQRVVNLPKEVSDEIWANAIGSSAVMQLASDHLFIFIV